MLSILLKLILAIIPAVLGIRKARNDYIIANKRTSAEKKAALKSSLTMAVGTGALSIIFAVLLFTSEIFDSMNRERSSNDRHQDIKTNLLTVDQVAEAVRKGIGASAVHQNETRRDEFLQKYPEGYVIFSVSHTNLSKEITLWNANSLKFEWNGAEVSSLTSNEINFALIGVRLSGPFLFEGGRMNYSLLRAKGATSAGPAYTVGINPILNLRTNISMVIEVAESNPMGVVMIAGFQKTTQHFEPRKARPRPKPK